MKTICIILLASLCIGGCSKKDIGCGPTKSIQDVYNEMVTKYGKAEEINTYSSGDYSSWSCWYWSRGFEYDISKERGEDAYVSSWYTFTPIRKCSEEQIPVGDG